MSHGKEVGPDGPAYRIYKKIPMIGIIFAALGSFLLESANLLAKLSTMNKLQMLVARSIIQIVFFGAIILWNKVDVRATGERWFLFVRSAAGFVNMAAMYYALEHVPLGDTIAIVNSSVIFIVILACIFLKEPWTYVQVTAILVGIVGAAFISRPSFIFGSKAEDHSGNKNRLLGLGLAFAACLGNAILAIMLRKLKRTPSSTIILWLSVFVAIAAFFFQLATNNVRLPANWTDVGILLAFGLLNSGAQYSITTAFKLEEAGPVGLTRTLSIVFSFFFHITSTEDPIYWTSVLGGIVILLSVASVAIEKWHKSKPEVVERIFPFIKWLKSNKAGKTELPQKVGTAEKKTEPPIKVAPKTEEKPGESKEMALIESQVKAMYVGTEQSEGKSLRVGVKSMNSAKSKVGDDTDAPLKSIDNVEANFGGNSQPLSV